MRVRTGWSGETSSNTWQKHDVTLEKDDLDRVFREHGLDPALSDRLPTQVCYQLLQNEAERLLLTKLVTFGYPADKAGARSAVLVAQSNEIVGVIQKKLTSA